MAGLSNDIADYLKEYYREERFAIKGREICELFNLTDKQVRNIVSGLRQAGEPICSSIHGYWYSNNPEDIEKTLRRLEGQVNNMNSSITGLKRILAGGEQDENSMVHNE